MKKSITLLTLLFITMFSFAQTSNENITIKKRNGSISYDSYIKGRNRYIASIPFWVGTAVEGAGSIASFAIANSLKNDCINNHNHADEWEGGAFCDNGNLAFWLIGGFMAVGTVMYAIPATILTISSHRKLNAAVEGYNQKSSDVTLNFGATNNGFGLTLNF